MHKVHHFLMNYRCKVSSFFLNESQLFIYKIKLYQLFTHVRISKGTILRTWISHFPLPLGVIFTQEPNLVFWHMPQKKDPSPQDVSIWKTWVLRHVKYIKTCLQNVRHFIQIHSHTYWAFAPMYHGPHQQTPNWLLHCYLLH
jgi:hypothetical protein